MNPVSGWGSGLTGDPGHVGGVGPGQPVGGHKVVEAQRVQADLEGTEVQVPVGPLVAPAGGGLGEDRGGGVPSSLDEDSLCQLKVEVSRCL